MVNRLFAQAATSPKTQKAQTKIWKVGGRWGCCCRSAPALWGSRISSVPAKNMDGHGQNCQMLACDSTCEVALLSFRISGCKVLTAAEGYIQVTSLVKSSGYSPVTQMVMVNHQNSSKVELQQQEAYLKWRKRWGRPGRIFGLCAATRVPWRWTCGMRAAGCQLLPCSFTRISTRYCAV